MLSFESVELNGQGIEKRERVRSAFDRLMRDLDSLLGKDGPHIEKVYEYMRLCHLFSLEELKSNKKNLEVRG